MQSEVTTYLWFTFVLSIVFMVDLQGRFQPDKGWAEPGLG